ncbi:hypothetical protein D9619_011451 [Psilocybe cf. subviscida]|uniref:Uncharacterized protein n=1 Tax=Psilocybe cf. subviscida TaxID=2480587 RepID=A0A8H5BSI9_9AGAR|nr:hypothetical protein D9619_011451 [Psilocybe cf. subviscida]
MLSNTRYNLRARPAPEGAEPASPKTPTPPLTPGAPSPDAPRRSYSEVAASRPPTPTFGSRVEAAPVGGSVISTNEETINIKKNLFYDNVTSTSSESGSPERDYEDMPGQFWQEVKGKKAKRAARKEQGKIVHISAKLDKAIREAEKALTPEQMQTILRRNQKVMPREESTPAPIITKLRAVKEQAPVSVAKPRAEINSVPEVIPQSDNESRGEGPSNRKDKGKGVDPREWGNLSENGEDIDIEAQRRALHEYNHSHRMVNPATSAGISRATGQSVSALFPSRVPAATGHKNTRPAESQPLTQIDPKSYLGVTLKKVSRKKNGSAKRKRKVSSPSSSSSSSLSDENNDGSEPDKTSDKLKQQLKLIQPRITHYAISFQIKIVA